MSAFLIFFIILLWPFGHFLTLPSPLPNLNWHPLDFVLAFLWLQLLLSPQSRHQIKKDFLTRPLFFFSLAALFSLILNPLHLVSSSLLISSSYLLRFLLPFSLYYALRFHRDYFKKTAFTSLLIFILLSLLQYFFFPDLRFIKYLGFDDHYYRLVSPLLDPNFAGLIFISAFHLFSSLKKNSPLKYFLLFLSLVSLALTFSRASYLVFFASLLLSFLLRHKKINFKQLAFIPLLFFLLVFLIPKPFGEGVNLLRTYSIYSRLNTLKIGLTQFSTHPIFGLGFNTLRYLQSSRFTLRTSGVDNSFIYLLATTGLFGFSAFIYLLLSIYKKLKTHSLGLVLFAALLLHSLFNNTLFFLWFQLFYLYLLAFSIDQN